MLSIMVLLNYLKNRVYSLLVYSLSKNNKLIIQENSGYPVKGTPEKAWFKNTPPKPVRIWIDGKCFNVKAFKKRKALYNSKFNGSTDTIYGINEVRFATKENGQITTSFQLPEYYYKKIRFDMINDVKSIMERTNTNILIPKVGENEKLRVQGNEKKHLIECLKDIYSLIAHIRNDNRPLQFISIPLCNEQIKNSFVQFKENVLNETEIKGLDESIFMSPLKLHLTVDVLVLLDDREKEEAKRALTDYHDKVMKPLLKITGPLKVKVSGIGCMNNNYEKTHVLYAKAKLENVNCTTNLQNIVNGLSDFFYERGLLKQHQPDVTIHMTLINTKYRHKKDTKGSKILRHNRFMKRTPFDSTKILEKYKDFDFGRCDLNSIQISNMSAIDESGFYEPLATIEL